jgi:HK97 family phage portal protein
VSVIDRILGPRPEVGQPIVDATLKRDVAPLEGTNMSLFNSIIPDWWAQNELTSSSLYMPIATLPEKLWVAARCIQLNAQQIASMPLRFEGPPSAQPPAWLSSPDANWYPNGIGDVIFAIVSQMYARGFTCLYITDTYFDGYPRSWTVLDSSIVQITVENGSRVYKINELELDPARIVQIDRNPGNKAHGTSALTAYAQMAWGMLAAGNQSMTVNQGGIPLAVLKSQRKLTSEQAEAIQTQWMTATQRRNGAPPVLPPELDFTPLQFKPGDIQLLESQQWSVGALATAFGVPVVLLNQALQGGLTYQNPGALGEMWWRFELRPTGKRVVDAFTARMLPAGQWVWVDARDTFLPLDPSSTEDDPQSSAVAATSPAQQQPPKLTALGGNTG